jgi:catechol-2,3-dioxygenase
MIFEPSVIVLYAEKLALSSNFYRDLLGIMPEEHAPTFHEFKLSNGMSLALKAKHTVEPPTDKNNGNGELAFTVNDPKKVDELFAHWQAKEINIIHAPTSVPYGYTFLAQDPDANRLRIVSLEKPPTK